MMVIHHFTLPVAMVISTSLSTSSMTHTVTHYVRTMMVIHHFTLLVVVVMHIVQYLLSTGKVDPLAIPMYKSSKLSQPEKWWYGKEVSLLHLAAAHGWVDIVIDLITKYKCNAHCKDSCGCTPAAHNNHLEVVRYFITEHHCDPMTRDSNSDTPLHIACHYGYLNIAQC